MQTGIFPDQLKIGSVTPVYKSGEKELLKNYRPISTLPLFGKIFEKVIYSRMYNFLQSQNILYNGQFGCIKHYSSSHALNYSVEEILEANESKLHTIGIFIDLSKAFDTIDHTKLLSKLECYGIRSNAHSLISSYLSNRQQYIKFLNEKSDVMPINYGVPQGSVLGPLHFSHILIYMNIFTGRVQGVTKQL